MACAKVVYPGIWGAYNRILHRQLQVWIGLLTQLGLDIVLSLYKVCETAMVTYLKAYFMER